MRAVADDEESQYHRSVAGAALGARAGRWQPPERKRGRPSDRYLARYFTACPVSRITWFCRLDHMAQEVRSPAAYAADIDAAKDRMISFVDGCTDEDWHAAPVDGDPRPVAVIVDHVAHAYEYLAGWIRQIVVGQQVEINSDVVDALNAQHAREAAAVSKAEAAVHLRRNGAAISGLVADLTTADLEAGDGRVRRLAQIAISHADEHRADIETALAAQGSRRR